MGAPGEHFAKNRGSNVARSSNAERRTVLQNDLTVSSGDVTLHSDEVTVEMVLARRYQRYTAKCNTDTNVIKHTLQ